MKSINKLLSSQQEAVEGSCKEHDPKAKLLGFKS